MLECLILGDSIAVGTQYHRPECHITARVGINSWQFNRLYPERFYAGTVIISLGSNDHHGINTKSELEALRGRVEAHTRVYWILPAGNLKGSGVQKAVLEVATIYGDTVLPITSLQTDGIHPSWSGYKNLAAQTKP